VILNRRSALVLLGAGAVAACSRSDDGALLKVGSQRGGTKAMMEASGALKGAPFTVEWSEFPAAQPLLEAIGAGAVDLGGVGDAPFLFAYQSGSPIRSIQATRYDTRNPATAILVPAASALKDARDLRGKRVATGRGSVGHFLLLRAMDCAGLQQKDLTTVFLPPGDAKGAFDSNAVDAWATWNPYVAQATLHGGARVIANARDLGPNYGFVAANERSIVDKRALIADFLERNNQAQLWAGANTDAYAAVLARETGLAPDVARQFGDRALIVVPSDALLLGAMQTVIDTFQRTGVLKATRPLAPAFDTSFDTRLRKGASTA
jgi:sulfonate transport system substrate-binding protein